jgi:hypothetical protein
MSKSQEPPSASVNTSLGRMRPATNAEIREVWRKREERAAWEAARHCATRLFGEQARTVQIITGDEYDDERYFPVIEQVLVFDAEGHPLPYDLSLPYWSHRYSWQTTSLREDFEQALAQEEAQAETPLSPAERAEFLQAQAHEYIQDQNIYVDEFALPTEDAFFALDAPPPDGAIPVLYVLEEEHRSGEK